MNNSNYSSNQILIDTSSFSNSGKYVNYREAYLSVPLVLALYPTTAVTGWDALTTCNFAAGLKAGYWNVIDSLSVEYNNTTVIQLTRTSNYYLNYKMTSSLSMSDVIKTGSTIGFWPDTVEAFEYSGAAAPSGRGISNNKDFGFENLYPSNRGILYNAAAVNLGASPLGVANTLQGDAFDGLYATNYPAITGTTQATANFGLYKRQQAIAFDPTQAPYSSFLNTSATQQLLKSYFASVSNGTTANAGYKVWKITATIYLRHLHDFFDKIVPVKGAYFRFVVNTNTGYATLSSSLQAATTTTPALTKWTQTASTFPNNTVPVMLASSQPGQGSSLIDPDGTKTWILQLGIASVTAVGAAGNTGTITHNQNSVRLYAPLYSFDPSREETYLKVNGTKTIVYTDIYQFVIPGVESGGTINSLLSNGIVNPRSIVIAPMISATDNGGLGIAPQNSVFATEPATVAPLSYLKQFNVLVAGVNALMLNEDFSFQNFVDQAQHQWALNGGLSDTITSGLINEQNYGLGFGWIVVNISRRIPIEDNVPKSIQVVGTSQSQRKLDFFCYVETQRSISINLKSGELTKA